jgi:hypothetical protein
MIYLLLIYPVLLNWWILNILRIISFLNLRRIKRLDISSIGKACNLKDLGLLCFFIRGLCLDYWSCAFGCCLFLGLDSWSDRLKRNLIRRKLNAQCRWKFFSFFLVSFMSREGVILGFISFFIFVADLMLDIKYQNFIFYIKRQIHRAFWSFKRMIIDQCF